MKKSLTDRLKAEIDKRGLSIADVARDTEIPRHRIYAWYRDNTQPKAEDAEKLEQWISKETFTEEAPATDGEVKINATVLRSLEDLSYSCRTNADNIKGLVENDRVKARSIEALVKILAVSLGVSVDTGLVHGVRETDLEAETFLRSGPGKQPTGKTKDGQGRKRGAKGS